MYHFRPQTSLPKAPALAIINNIYPRAAIYTDAVVLFKNTTIGFDDNVDNCIPPTTYIEFAFLDHQYILPS